DGVFHLTARVLAFDEVIGAREVGDAFDAAERMADVAEPPPGVPRRGYHWWTWGDLSRFVVVATAGLASNEKPSEAQDDQAAELSQLLYDEVCLQVRLGYR
ncbi:MAG TPA: hypothetical protein VGF17_17850, partial [Phytomonospora sp.]